MTKQQQIEVQWMSIKLSLQNQEEYVSLTDIARYKNNLEPKKVVENRLRLKNTIEYLWLRERLNNPDFKGLDFEAFENKAGSNAFTLSPKRWIENTNAIGLISKAGNTWWTFAHKDIAIKFANRISVEFELYLIKEFQRLKEQEHKSLDRNIKRFLTKMNYRIHTDAIKAHLIPTELKENQINFIYADEADVLNTALFGQTAKEWRSTNPKKTENIRDEASIQQLIVLANIESINAEFIKMGMSQPERLQLLNKISIDQMTSLLGMSDFHRRIGVSK